MRKFLFFFLILGFAFDTLHAQNTGNENAWREKVSPEIRAAFDRGEAVDLLAVFREKADLSGARFVRGKSAKARFVYDRLMETASRTQANAIRLLRERQAKINSFSLVNAIVVDDAAPEIVRMLAALPEVAALAPDPEVTLEMPRQGQLLPAERGAVEWGVQKINAPAVWALGYSGQGITIGGADTGYEWEHPALKAHYRGWNEQNGVANHHYNWHDAIHEISPLSGDSIPDPANNPCGVNAPAPCDDHNHGTHTMGTMTGDDGLGNQIGVAPGAQWVGCRNMERGNGKTSSYIECFEWFLAPTDLDGKNPDVTKAPHVINNSWYCSYEEGCTDLAVMELMRIAVSNLKASGVVVVVSNGNSGSFGCGSTSGPPAFFEESFSVGATESNDTITGFSSRGPVLIDGSMRTKPNVVAPGAGVRSAVRNGGYQHFWGTSMAGPHVAGLVALLLSARPDLAGEVDIIENLIEETAVPKFDEKDCSDNGGQNYPNNTYGYGRINALAAIQEALDFSPVSTNEPAMPGVKVYPNPVADEAIFDVQYVSGKTTLDIFSADGKCIFNETWTAVDRQLVPVQLQNLPEGVYFWKLTSGAVTQAGKLIKQ